MSIYLMLSACCRMCVTRKFYRLITLVRLSFDAVAGSVLAGVVVVGGEGLDLGAGEVDGAGGGDGR